MTTTARPAIDLQDPARYVGGQPHELFDWLRANEPVHRHPEIDGPGFWALTRHADVVAVGKRHQVFSSEPTIMIADSAMVADPDHKMMLMADPPLHTRMRRLVNRRFTPRSMAALAARAAELATAIVDAVAEEGRCDLVTDLAGEMPSYVVADLMGLPLDDGRQLYEEVTILHSSDGALSPEAKGEAAGRLLAYSNETYARKRAEPGDDLGSLLAHGRVGDRPVDEMDFFLWFLLLVDAGSDTTRNLIGGGFEALFGHPDQLAALRDDVDARLDPAIEEMLRWVSPVVHMRRTATADTEIGGRAIAAGEKVVMYYGAANRDPEVFDQPHQLRLDRQPNPHVAFGGGGPHFCLGSHLARLEARALFREILHRLPDLEPDGETRWVVSDFVHGPSHLPVRFTPTARLGSGL